MSEKIAWILSRGAARLNVERLARAGVWTLTAALVFAAVFVVFDRLFALGVGWQIPLAIAFAMAAVAALLLTIPGWRTRVDAAIEIDAREGWKERLSTLAALPDAMRDSPASIALAHDVQHRLDSQAANSIPIARPPFIWAPLVALAVLFACFLWIDPIEGTTPVATTVTDTKQEKETVEKEADKLTQRIQEKKHQLDAKGGDELKQLLADIERATRELREAEITSEEAALKLSDLARRVEQNLANQESTDRLKESLSRLTTPDSDPAGLERSLRDGDFEKAARQLEALQKQLAKESPSPETSKALSQLADIEEQLRKSAQLARQAKEVTSKEDNGGAQEQLEELVSKAKQSETLEKLADALGEIAKAADNLDVTNLKESVDPSGTDLERLLEELGDAEELLRQLAEQDEVRVAMEDLLDDLNQSRGMIVRGEPGDGEGQGEGEGEQARAKGGKGWGTGKGELDGEKPEPVGPSKSKPSRSPGTVGPGASVILGRIDGPNTPGESQIEVSESVEAAAAKAEEAMTRQPVPDPYKRHTREYFEQLRGNGAKQK